MNLTNPESRRVSFRHRVNNSIHSLSLFGKTIFTVLAIIFVISALSLLLRVNNFFIVSVPQHGGILTEGVIGLPRYINPVLAITDGDKDIASLVYAGLMRQTPQGDIVTDLAESYSVSDDGKTYTFVLKPNLTFTDRTALTADDVMYTIAQIQNPAIKSPRHANWDGVTATKIDDRTVSFTLRQAYAPFLENLTIGILPKHIWTTVTADAFALSDINMNPIGEGPFAIRAISKNSNGIPSSYELSSNGSYTSGKPLIDSVIFKFYPNEKALETAYQSGDVDSVNSISPDVAVELQKSGGTMYTASLPRVFGVFFNQSQNPILALPEVRQALDMSVDRDYIVNTVLHGFGTPLMGPVPQSFIGDSPSTSVASSSPETLVTEANALLDKAGWKLNADGIREKKLKTGTTTLAFAISTSDAPELKEVADIIKSQWKKIGIDVELKFFEGGNLNQNIIRPRKYDALLFGQIVNRDLDLYAFWHSSQKNDPGLNIALYDNGKADKILENIRTLSDKNARLTEYQKFQDLLANDTPAVFLYSPDFLYLAPKEVKNIVIDHLTTPSERFNGITSWYIDTDRVWKVFAHNQ